MTYQSRFGVRADTPDPTGNSELFKRPYRLLYLPWRKASCRETKDVPLPKDTRPHSRRFAQETASTTLEAQRCVYTLWKKTLGAGHISVEVAGARGSRATSLSL